MFFNHAGECFVKMGRSSGRHAAIRYMLLSTIDQLTRGTELPISLLVVVDIWNRGDNVQVLSVKASVLKNTVNRIIDATRPLI